ncbi:hypothetical protein M085_4652 [Bacteroides fragilis str. 3986 N(B)19]|nr:hypothetical protein M085_4652 [Bacteroides fragilis str. 3986 N(B)19]
MQGASTCYPSQVTTNKKLLQPQGLQEFMYVNDLNYFANA